MRRRQQLARVVLQHGAALDGCLGVADGLADPRLEDEVAEVLLQHLDGLLRMERPAVVHRREDPADLDRRVEVLADHRERVLELDEPAEREVLALHRDDDAVRGGQGVDRQEAERRRRVDEDVVVAASHGEQRLLQRALAPDHAREGELGAREVDRRDGEVDLGPVDHLVDREAVDEDVEHRALDRVRVHALAHGQVALRIEVDREHVEALLLECDGEIERRRRLRDAALLVGERDDLTQLDSLRSRRPLARTREDSGKAHRGLLFRARVAQSFPALEAAIRLGERICGVRVPRMRRRRPTRSAPEREEREHLEAGVRGDEGGHAGRVERRRHLDAVEAAEVQARERADVGERLPARRPARPRACPSRARRPGRRSRCRRRGSTAPSPTRFRTRSENPAGPERRELLVGERVEPELAPASGRPRPR